VIGRVICAWARPYGSHAGMAFASEVCVRLLVVVELVVPYWTAALRHHDARMLVPLLASRSTDVFPAPETVRLVDRHRRFFRSRAGDWRLGESLAESSVRSFSKSMAGDFAYGC
jgi:hypothetical protein